MQVTVEVAVGDNDDRSSGRRRVADETGGTHPGFRVWLEGQEVNVGHDLLGPIGLDTYAVPIPLAP